MVKDAWVGAIAQFNPFLSLVSYYKYYFVLVCLPVD
jgi:hypothetical protein